MIIDLGIKKTPQSEPMLNKNQVQNNAGGYVFALDKWAQLNRFLILGSQGGTYYASEQKLTKDNLGVVLECIKEDGKRVVDITVQISESARAPKNEPALIVLAAASAAESLDVRRYALSQLPRVARIGTHLFHFVAYCEQFRGWGRALKRAVADWYNTPTLDKVIYQTIKYKNRDGWSNRDLLRLSHPKATGARERLYHWITKQDAVPQNPELDRVAAAVELSRCEDVKHAIKLITEYDLPRECVNTQLLNSTEVWDALLQKMPYTATLRSLSKLGALGMLSPLSETSRLVRGRITNQEQINRSKTHPIALLSALRVYAQGHGEKGNLTWVADQQVVSALDEAFYLAFGNVEPTGKQTIIAIDCSGSMDSGEIAGVAGLTPRIASAAMAMVTIAKEKECCVMGFTAPPGGRGHGGKWGGGVPGLTFLPIHGKMRLDDAVRVIEQVPMGGTDCAVPIVWALQNNVAVDSFIIYTDNETWAGSVHPKQALDEYRRRSGIKARLAVVGMTSTGFSIADPSDAGMLDVVGFDTATPNLMSEFFRGNL